MYVVFFFITAESTEIIWRKTTRKKTRTIKANNCFVFLFVFFKDIYYNEAKAVIQPT